MLVLQILFDCKIDFQFSDEKIDAQVVIFDFILSANRHRRKKYALVLF